MLSIQTNAQIRESSITGLGVALDSLDKHHRCYSSYRSELLKPYKKTRFKVRFYPESQNSYDFLINQTDLRWHLDSPFVRLNEGKKRVLTILSSQNGQPLSFVFIQYCGKTQALNLNAGKLEIGPLMKECDSIKISAPGFMSIHLKLVKRMERLVWMEELGLLREFEQTALKDYHWLRFNSDLGNEQVEPNTNFLSLLGEHDPVQAIRILPGIQGGGENVPGIIVRGAEPEQNLVLMNDVPLYKSSHLFGFTSVFSSDVIEKIDVHKNFIPSEFGGRSSGVIDFTTHEGNYLKHSGMGSIGLLSTKVGLNGPIYKGKVSYHAHFRRSNIDWLMKPLLSGNQLGAFVAGDGLNYVFFDAHLRLDWKPGQRHHLFFTAYNGRDQGVLGFENENTEFPSFFENSRRRFSWGNQMAALHWHIKDEKGDLRFKSTVYSTSYEMRTGDVYTLTQEYRDSSLYRLNQQFIYRAGISDIGIKTSWHKQFAGDRIKLKSGLHLVSHQINRGQREIFSAINEVVVLDTNLTDQTRRLSESEIYADASFKSQSNKLLLNAAVLISSFDFYRAVLLPRWRFRWQLDSAHSLFLGQSVQRQFLQALPNTQTNIPMQVWWPSDERIQPLDQHLLFVGWSYVKSGLRLSTELFYALQDGLYEIEAGANLISSESPVSRMKQGGGRSWGSESLLEYSTEKWRAIFAYGYLNYIRQIDGINNGERYQSRFDKPHDIKINLLRKLGENGLLSLSWWYNSGGMISLPTSRYQTDLLGNTVIRDHYTRVNNYRMPAYHRLDVSYSRHRSLKFGQQSWQIGLFNAYNHRNPLFVNLITDAEQKISTQIVGLLPLLPVVYYEIRF